MADMHSQKTILIKVFRYIRPHRTALGCSIFLAAVQVVMTLYIPILVGNAIDCIVDAG